MTDSSLNSEVEVPRQLCDRILGFGRAYVWSREVGLLKLPFLRNKIVEHASGRRRRNVSSP